LPEEFDRDRERIPEFVLGRFAEAEQFEVDRMTARACDALALVVKDQIDLAISISNGDNPTPEQ
jgi:peptidyl-tRNA hydrolase